MDPYKVLGVRRNATPETILKAFRRMVRKAHPDCGGTTEQFEELRTAFAVLNDPEARTRYDATGEARAPRATNPGLVNTVLHEAFRNAVMAIVNTGRSAKTSDPVVEMRSAVGAKLREINDAVKKLVKVEKDLREFCGRVSGPPGDQTLFAMAEAEVADVSRSLEKVRADQDAHEKALAHLKACSYRRDPAGPKERAARVGGVLDWGGFGGSVTFTDP